MRTEHPIVVGLPRGGVPVAEEIARSLGAPLDVCVVRKVASPSRPEVGLGAVAEGGEIWLSPHVERFGVTAAEVAAIVEAKLTEVEARVRALRGARAPLDVRGRCVIVVDDGIANGGTARAALRALRRRGAARLVLASPVGAAETIATLGEADEVVCPWALEDLSAVGLWYQDFSPTTDAEVQSILAHAAAVGTRRS